MPYFSKRMFMMASLTLLLTFSSSKGHDPMRMLSCSPSMTSDAVFLIWFWARWISRSVIMSAGSSSPSPILTVTDSPLASLTTPRIESGMVVHWYFLIPP